MKKIVNKIKDTLSILHSSKGFTLLELLVVVVIIAILAGIALPQYRRATERARAMEAVQTVRILSDAIERYYLANGTYPTGDWKSKLDIEVPSSQFFYYSFYTQLYIAMIRSGNKYMISKVFNSSQGSVYRRGLTCNVYDNDLENTIWGDVCRDLCQTKELTKVWGGSPQKGCKIKF